MIYEILYMRIIMYHFKRNEDAYANNVLSQDIVILDIIRLIYP